MAAGHELNEFSVLPREIVAPARSLDGRPKSIDNPAQDRLDHSRGRIGWVVLDARFGSFGWSGSMPRNAHECTVFGVRWARHDG
ncbi:MAG: hypothetical protein JO046_14610 [Solirubrobacterales bacterium]|nr:hypothetical protein [Solirubrobacterales bacterium]